MSKELNIKMLVAAHKAAEVPSDDFYLPIHVGHALNPIDLGYQRDDEGENISELNPSYCELTALYWAWKNLDADVVGLSHYRRYFRGKQPGPNGKGILSRAESVQLLDKHDIVLSRPRNYVIETIDSHYRNGHHGSDLDVLRGVIEKDYPDFLNSYDKVFSGRELSLYNMFLMRKRDFNEYCEWLFGILDFVEPEIDNDSRSVYQQRTFGYLGERLLNVWVEQRSSSRAVSYLGVVNTEGEPKLQKAKGLLARKLRGRAAR